MIVRIPIRPRLSTNHEYFVRVMKQSVYRALGKRITQFRAIRPSGKRKWMLPLQAWKSHERCVQPF